MNFNQAMNVEVSAAAARREVEEHGQKWADFVKEKGERATYRGRDVLIWLGY